MISASLGIHLPPEYQPHRSYLRKTPYILSVCQGRAYQPTLSHLGTAKALLKFMSKKMTKVTLTKILVLSASPAEPPP